MAGRIQCRLSCDTQQYGKLIAVVACWSNLRSPVAELGASWLCGLPVQGDVEEMDVEQTAPSAEEKGKGKATAPSNGKRFEIKKWNAVAMWSWAICTDTCAICRNNLYEPSIEYQVPFRSKSSISICP